MSTHDLMHGTNGNEASPDGTSPHEALCALVLGELEGDERAALERELERSPELRAERARIEATIGLVRAACGGPEALSAGAVARLEGLAEAKRRPWYASGTFRMAAGFGLVALSLVLWNEGARRRAPAEELLARAERPAGEIELRRSEAEAKLARTAGRAPAPSGAPMEEAPPDASTFSTSTLQDELSKRLGDVESDTLETRTGVPDESGLRRSIGQGEAYSTWKVEQEGADAARAKRAEGEWPALDAGLFQLAEELQAQTRQQDQAGAAAPPVDAGGRFEVRAGLDGPQADKLGQIGYVAKHELRVMTVDPPVLELGVVKDALAPETPALQSADVPWGGQGAPAPFRTNEIEFADNLTDFDGEPSAGVVEEQIQDANRPSSRSGFTSALFELDSSQSLEGGLYFMGRLPESSPDAGTTPEVLRRSAAASGNAGPSGPASPGPATWSPTPTGGGGGGDGGPRRAAGGGGGALENDGSVFGLAGETVFGEELEQLDDKKKGAADDFFLGGERERRLDDLGSRLDPETEIRLRIERVLHDCRRHPNEKPSAMYFRFWGDNGFELAQLDPQSTFGVDVDTASYALARRYLRDGYLPEKAQIRTEEFVNYFDADVPAPTESTFAIRTELAPSRFGSGYASGIRVASVSDRWMLRVAVRGKDVSREERQPLALTFVVDVSGSMKEGNRLELVKHALRLLAFELDARDSIAIVAFSSEARMVLPMTSAAQRGVIEAALYGLNADGSTNAEAGLLMGYALASASLSQAAQSRVVLLSDGVANVGQTDQDRINAEVARQRAAGIYLNTIGVGMGNVNDVFLEQLANKGDGLCNYMDDELEARRALVENFTGAFTPIARDVKIQVEFDPSQVYRYRLLGYENRAIADRDFRNDAVDAGEVGAGHQVVALYELELLKPEDEAPLATVRLRWKQPSGAGRDPLEDSATEVEAPVRFKDGTAWEGSSDGYKRSVLVAQFAELLRRSTHARDDSLDELIAESAALAPRLKDADFTEFLAMVERSRELVLRARPAYEPISQCVDRLRRNECLRAEYESLRLDSGHALLDDLERQNRELEARIRGLIREQVDAEIR